MKSDEDREEYLGDIRVYRSSKCGIVLKANRPKSSYDSMSYTKKDMIEPEEFESLMKHRLYGEVLWMLDGREDNEDQ